MQKAQDWYFHHPMLLQMREYGFADPLHIQAALQAYLDLTEVKQWHRVSVHPCSSQRVIYLRAQQREEDLPECIIPLAATEFFLDNFEDYLQAINKCEAAEHTRLTLAMVDSDSTIVYYHMYQGLHPPTPSPLSQKHQSHHHLQT